MNPLSDTRYYRHYCCRYYRYYYYHLTYISCGCVRAYSENAVVSLVSPPPPRPLRFYAYNVPETRYTPLSSRKTYIITATSYYRRTRIIRLSTWSDRFYRTRLRRRGREGVTGGLYGTQLPTMYGTDDGHRDTGALMCAEERASNRLRSSCRRP